MLGTTFMLGACSSDNPNDGQGGLVNWGGADVPANFVGDGGDSASSDSGNAGNSGDSQGSGQADAGAHDVVSSSGGGLDAGAPADSGAQDVGPTDTGSTDSASSDSTGVDSGSADAGCAPTNGGKESCDGLDNDCNGQTDEGTCDDDNFCTSDVCAAGKCTNTPTTGGPCDDGDLCTLGELCDKGQCGGGTLTCACKVDADCQTGNVCFGEPFCEKKGNTAACKIKPGTAVVCSEANDTACAKNVCDPASGKCFMTAVAPGSPCDDGDTCTTNDACSQGLCKAGPSQCECKEDKDCAAKDDGNPCNGVLKCDKGTNKCQLDQASIVSCANLGGACQANKCDPATGKCAASNAPDGTGCNDGDVCTGGDVCKAGKCEGGAKLCECKTNLDCAGKTGGDKCIGTFSCVGNKCSKDPGSEVKCKTDKDTACLKAACVAATGACELKAQPDGAICNPTGPCQTGGKCSAGQCQAAAGNPCDDSNPCTKDACADGKCTHTALPDGTACEGGQCDKGACSGGETVETKFVAVADAFIEGSSKQGKHTHLILGQSGGYPKKRSLVRFDLAKIGKGKKVLKATLRVYVDYWHVPGSVGAKEPAIDRPIEVFGVRKAWSETGVNATSTGVGANWSKKLLATDDTDADKVATDTQVWQAGSKGWKEFDVTALAKVWVADPTKNHGVLLKAQNEDTKGREPRCWSKDAKAKIGFAPSLVVQHAL